MDGFQQYRHNLEGFEVEAIQFTLDNGEQLADKVGMEFIPQLEKLFRPGRNDGAPVGAWILLTNDGYVSALYDKDFQDLFTLLPEHPYIATMYDSDGPRMDSECGVCRGDVNAPYHREPVDGETVLMYDRTPLIIHTK